ncbi:MAG: phosphopantetheine-binding protein [Planctomycetota bacterium]
MGWNTYDAYDAVELVMAVEEEFKIALSDTDAEQCVTVDNLVDLVYSRVRHNDQEPCPAQHGFYVIRRRMMDRLGLERSRIRPETKLEDLIGRENRRKVLLELIQPLAGKTTAWPRLVRPKRMNRIVVAWIPGAVWIGTTLMLYPTFAGSSFAMGLLAGIAVLMIGNRLTASFKQEFPDEFTRVQDLIKFVSSLDSRIWSREDVFNKVRTITVEILGVKESQVIPKAKFVDDLKVGK